MVDTDVLLLLESGVAPLFPVFSLAEAAALASLSSNSLLSPCSAKGAGSTPRRVNRSARDAKQRRAPSDTCKHGEEQSSCQTCILIHKLSSLLPLLNRLDCNNFQSNTDS